MPPFLPRKRSTPPASPRPVPAKRAKLTDALDAEATNNVPSLKKTKTFSVDSDSSSDSSLSDVDSDQFEDVWPQSKRSTAVEEAAQEDEDEDEDVEWEDAAPDEPIAGSSSHTPMANGPIQITLRKDDEGVIDYGASAKVGSGRKGPSKREKQVRIMTHQLHVQFLLWHNAIRNNWIGDKEVQDILVKQLPAQIANEVTKWKRSSGLEVPQSSKIKSVKGSKRRKTKEELDRNQRDWGKPSQRLEAGKPDMSHGDPIFSLMKVLSAYWKKRFAITAPGLRKRGYGTKHALKQEITSLRTDEHDPERHGEKIQNLDEFRNVAQKAEGSRDVGAQLFTALLRGLGIEARLVASLQPSGYGWAKAEQMVQSKPVKSTTADETETNLGVKAEPTPSTNKNKLGKPVSSSRRKSAVISLDTDTEEVEGTDDEMGKLDIEDDESVVDITPSLARQRKPKYDRDLVFPIYWTEVVSPITNQITPVSPLVLETSVANTPETLLLFEPKGAKAEKGRQVMAYVVAYSSDGSAKDVTVRYLRKHIWPGKTKGFRMPVEKVPIYDKRGKIKRHEDYDWFKYTLSAYTRSDTKRKIVDDIEDSTDLVPQQPEKMIEDEGADTLQSLKSSADFVLERFLRREEALQPNAKPVRTFVSGKGDKHKEEPVYRRADVERCLSAESWHKEGRRPKLGEAPMKMVPVRAVTLTRKREAEEHERQYGEKQMQGLYSWDQTEWIIPPPIKDGVIPKNSYGNMDCFVPSMVPKGAVHIPLKGTVRICKKLDIDFAEAVTGFEFGNKRAVPVCTGVVVAKENEKLVKDAWAEWNEEQRRKEETKMEKLVLDLWRKFVLGLRIRERVQDMYGEDLDGVDDAPTGFTKEDAIQIDDEEEQQFSGLPNQENDEEDMGGGFLLPHEEETAPVEALILDEPQTQPQLERSKKVDAHYPTPPSVSVEGQGTPRKDRRNTSFMNGQRDLHSMNSDDKKYDVDDDDDDDDDDDNPTTEFDPTSKTTRPLRSSKKRSRLNIEKVGPRRSTNDNGASSSLSTNHYSDSNTSDDGAGDDEDNDDEEDFDDGEQQEIYTPRPTRTRASKLKSAPTVKSSKVLDVVAAKTRSRPVSKSKTRSTSRLKANNSDSDVGEPSHEPATPATTSRRGRGRPRKTNSSKRDADTSKSSARQSKRQSTSIASPYFE